jgi:hypothetical protein
VNRFYELGERLACLGGVALGDRGDVLHGRLDEADVELLHRGTRTEALRGRGQLLAQDLELLFRAPQGRGEELGFWQCEQGLPSSLYVD